LRYNWFARLDDTSIDGMVLLSDEIDQYNYYSSLFTYHAQDPDPFIKAARVLNKNHVFKYMIAIRPYAVSPEYLAMMISSFEEIHKNRLMINIVCALGQNEENSLENMVTQKEKFDNHIFRQEYTRNYMKKIREILPEDSTVEFIISAAQDYDIETSNMYAHGNVMFYYDFLKNHHKVKNEINMVAIMAIIRDTHEEAEEQYNAMIKKDLQKDTIYGTEDEIADQINELSNLGATDVLINAHRIHQYSDKVMPLINKLAGKRQP
jgi:alkanesulfonate monooxygenase SsuD/methylene tetrahydromethanopterin reductase-like flavin-dependent oxidoreductase (luciferase family)